MDTLVQSRQEDLVACPLVPAPVLAPPPVVEVINVTLASRDDLFLKVGLLLPSTRLVTVSRLYLLILQAQLDWPAWPAILVAWVHLAILECAVCSVQCAVCSVQCAVCSVQSAVECAVFLQPVDSLDVA